MESAGTAAHGGGGSGSGGGGGNSVEKIWEFLNFNPSGPVFL